MTIDGYTVRARRDTRSSRPLSSLFSQVKRCFAGCSTTTDTAREVFEPDYDNLSRVVDAHRTRCLRTPGDLRRHLPMSSTVMGQFLLSTAPVRLARHRRGELATPTEAIGEPERDALAGFPTKPSGLRRTTGWALVGITL